MASIDKKAQRDTRVDSAIHTAAKANASDSSKKQVQGKLKTSGLAMSD